jgi:two-component system, cell cycle response regulator
MPGGPVRRPLRTTHPARRRLFVELLVWMAGLGLLVGLVFPPFLVLLGVPESLAFDRGFYLACLSAGLVVGAFNFLVACTVVRPRVRMLSNGMSRFRRALRGEDGGGAMSRCGSQRFHVPVDSQDQLGEAAESFNRLVDDLVEARRMQDAVGEFSATLASQLDLTPLCREALGVMLARTGAVGGALLVRREESLGCAAAHGLSDPERLVSRDDVRQALTDLRTCQVDSPAGLLISGEPPVHPRQMLLLPLGRGGRPLGILVLLALQPFTPEIFRLLEFFRQSLKLALQNALNHEHLGRMAATDSLTGCCNRRMGMETLARECARARRGGDPLGLVMLDIDHFKPVNDTWGHLAGDRILVQTAREVQKVLRQGDVLVRYGGEEFLILLPGASLPESLRVAERVRAAVAAMEIAGKGPERVTVSLGVGCTPGSGIGSPELLLQRVDEALYRAKSAGRNRVVAAECEGMLS